jgi:alkylated DNA repair dioxygenase AlkB
VVALSWQASLLDADRPVHPDLVFSTLRRVHLDDVSWVDHAPGWLHGSDEVFSSLLATTPWSSHTRWMYGERVAEPRLTWWWQATTGRPLAPAVLEEMRVLLGQRYGVEFDSVGLNLYRDGRDSVAWHADRIAD